MLVFRLFRIGKNNQPSYKIVVTDKRNPSRGGRFLEQIGVYNPVAKKQVLNKERAQYWLKQGVQPSATVHNLFVQEGILEGKKIPMHKKSKKAPASAPAGASAGKPAAAPAVAAVAPAIPAEASKPAENPADKPAEVKPQPKEESTPKEAPKPAEKVSEVPPQSTEVPKIE